MAEYRLHCFRESGNAFKVAMMLDLCGADWEPVFVPFATGLTPTPQWRACLLTPSDASERSDGVSPVCPVI